MRVFQLTSLVATLSIRLLASINCASAVYADGVLGIFSSCCDVGDCKLPGSTLFDDKASSYTLTGSGANMWGSVDAFQFVWTEATKNTSLEAQITWKGAGVDPHRKACLMMRESLAPNSPYVDVAVHGDGLTSIQYREETNGPTKEIQANVRKPKRVRLTREGDYVYMTWAEGDEPLHYSGGMFRIALSDTIHVGLAVCSHNNAVSETAVFSHVSLQQNLPASLVAKPTLTSTLERMPIRSTDRKIVYHITGQFEAPNWTPDGKRFIFNQQGKLYSIPVAGGEATMIPSGFATRINNDHGISPNGKQLVISDQTATGKSMIYTLPIEGGEPKQIIKDSPSYWHGWSPDGQTLVYCAQRNGDYDVYSCPVAGGQETRLTTSKGLDDGPEFSADGKTIYFNSTRSGSMKIWKMKLDGSEQTQVTFDEYQDWFAHPSPDGKWLAFISYSKDIPADAHPANKDVMIRLLSTEGGEPRTLAKLFGGQGTMNVPSWSPDSLELAFVSYRLVHIP